jgi:hypothetical protein
MSRGSSKCYGGLIPSIDRKPRCGMDRKGKLELERKGIDVFRSGARYFAQEGEKLSLKDDVIALMVLRHYNVPTRLLDWSKSPYVAAYFASRHHMCEDGEIWTFDHPSYAEKGKAQWMRWPETTSDKSGDDQMFQAEITAFTLDEPPDWFICCHYVPGFPRHTAQMSAYSMTARFGIDHADAIANLLEDSTRHHRYVLKASLKGELLRFLREEHGVWEEALYPDSAGAANIAKRIFAIGVTSEQ